MYISIPNFDDIWKYALISVAYSLHKSNSELQHAKNHPRIYDTFHLYIITLISR